MFILYLIILIKLSAIYFQLFSQSNDKDLKALIKKNEL